MATAKKVTKAKPPKPPKPPKVGAEVRFRRRNGELATGRIDGGVTRANGLWVGVNVSELRNNRDITFVRPSQLEYI